MPQVTPNRTANLRQNATFRGTRANPYASPALEKGNRTKKRKLINRARAALRDPDLKVAAEALVSVKRRWAKVGNAGAEHDKKLKKELEDIYEAFRARYEGVRARAIARNAKAGNAESTSGGSAEDEHTEKPYAQLGTGQSGDAVSPSPTVDATEPSQRGRILSQSLRRVGEGRRENRALATPATPPERGGANPRDTPRGTVPTREHPALATPPTPAPITPSAPASLSNPLSPTRGDHQNQVGTGSGRGCEADPSDRQTGGGTAGGTPVQSRSQRICEVGEAESSTVPAATAVAEAPGGSSGSDMGRRDGTAHAGTGEGHSEPVREVVAATGTRERAAGEGDGSAQGPRSNGASGTRYAAPGTVLSRDAAATKPSQAERTVASQPGNTVGGGTAGKPEAPAPLTAKPAPLTKHAAPNPTKGSNE